MSDLKKATENLVALATSPIVQQNGKENMMDLDKTMVIDVRGNHGSGKTVIIWLIVSLLEALGYGEVTVNESSPSMRLSRWQLIKAIVFPKYRSRNVVINTATPLKRS